MTGICEDRLREIVNGEAGTQAQGASNTVRPESGRETPDWLTSL